MIAVIFELTPAAGRKQEYLDLAAGLAAELKTFDGFVSISFWRDEDAVRRWRNVEQHREAQAKGRGGIFERYRLRVAQVLRDYTMQERGQAPQDSRKVHG